MGYANLPPLAVVRKIKNSFFAVAYVEFFSAGWGVRWCLVHTPCPYI